MSPGLEAEVARLRDDLRRSDAAHDAKDQLIRQLAGAFQAILDRPPGFKVDLYSQSIARRALRLITGGT